MVMSTSGDYHSIVHQQAWHESIAQIFDSSKNHKAIIARALRWHANGQDKLMDWAVLRGQTWHEIAIEFEHIYLQRRFDRIHFVCQSIHYLMHMAPETSRVGPNLYYSQWPIERTIGNLGEELKQHSNPYRNFSERCVLRAQVNTLKAMAPELDRNRDKIPRGAIGLGDGYFLLHATDSCACNLRKPENDALKQYIEQCTGLAIEENWATKVVRWARVKLPNGQISRCAWKETRKPLNKLRISRNVKVGFSHTFAS